MTGANLIGFLQPEASMQIDVGATSAKKDNGGDNTTMFASFMRETSVSGNSVKASDGGVTPRQSYDKFKYKDNSIEKSNDNPLKDKLESSKEVIQKLEKDVVSAVSNELDVDEEAVENAMASLGMNVFDLLQPSNLAELAVELTGAGDSVELLMSDSFLSLLGEVTELGNEFINELELADKQFSELIELMTEEELGVDSSTISDILDEALPQTSDMPEAGGADVVSGDSLDGEMQLIENNKPSSGDNVEVTNSNSEEVITDSEDDVIVATEIASDDNQDSDGEMNQFGDSDESGLAKAENEVKKNESIKTSGVIHSNVIDNVNTNTTELHEVQPQTSSYVSVDTVELIQQLVEKVKTTVASDFNNVEMQLNPENLGKIYINISSKEGNVSAHLIATNDVVREALEGQMAELRENLSQAGVKVDALEVTVASHGFERNLEQDQSRQEQEGAYQEKISGKRRRNLDISSLDELSGLMTEEERLVAQMMIDNGNSVDLTA